MGSGIICLNDYGVLMVEGSHVVKDRRIGGIRLDGEVRGRCSEKRLWSAGEKKPNLLGNGWTGGWELLELDLI